MFDGAPQCPSFFSTKLASAVLFNAIPLLTILILARGGGFVAQVKCSLVDHHLVSVGILGFSCVICIRATISIRSALLLEMCGLHLSC